MIEIGKFLMKFLLQLQPTGFKFGLYSFKSLNVFYKVFLISLEILYRHTETSSRLLELIKKGLGTCLMSCRMHINGKNV